ncbi:MAG: hypothetical protein R3C97_10885 [Geminicoccaceae bacterium]
MDKQQQAAGSNPEQLVDIMSDIAQRSQSIVEDFISRQAANGASGPSPEMNQLGAAFMELTARMMANPAEMMRAQFALWQDYMRLWQSTASG